MIIVKNHIDTDHIRNSDGSLNEGNGVRLLCEAIGIPHKSYGDVDDDIWDEALEFLNTNSFEYLEFVCNSANLNVEGVEGDLLSAISLQVELNNKLKEAQ